MRCPGLILCCHDKVKKSKWAGRRRRSIRHIRHVTIDDLTVSVHLLLYQFPVVSYLILTIFSLIIDLHERLRFSTQRTLSASVKIRHPAAKPDLFPRSFAHTEPENESGACGSGGCLDRCAKLSGFAFGELRFSSVRIFIDV